MIRSPQFPKIKKKSYLRRDGKTGCASTHGQVKFCTRKVHEPSLYRPQVSYINGTLGTARYIDIAEFITTIFTGSGDDPFIKEILNGADYQLFCIDIVLHQLQHSLLRQTA